MKISVDDIIEKKKKGERITMLTAYDYPMGVLVDKAGVDIALVGDSLANVVLGLESTKDVGMAEMLHHAKAVRRAVKHALLVGDMPYESYQKNPDQAVNNARRFIDEAGCDAVKLEWFDQCLDVAHEIIKAGIPVMGHVGLTPQTAQEFTVQGKDAQSAKEIIEQAKDLEKKGCFSIVLECVPAPVAQKITEVLTVPTIGIGAGPFCDGQVLVTHDLLGYYDRFHPKFVKKYADISSLILEAIKSFKKDVLQGSFPAEAHSFGMDKKQLNKII